VRRRLHELAAEALSPWVKLGEDVFRADLINDEGGTVTATTQAKATSNRPAADARRLSSRGAGQHEFLHPTGIDGPNGPT
jgi:hypothetical protein